MQARAHTLLRQKEGELAQARQSTADQFKNDLSVAEAAAAERQQQLQQVQTESWSPGCFA